MSTRRRTLQALGATAASSLSGCLFNSAGYRGVNKNLEVVNQYAEPVELHILVERNEPAGPQHRERIFEGNVTVAPSESKSLDVLGDYQLRITMTGLDQEMSF